MNSFSNPSPLFDLSQASTFSQLPDDDFLALLQKQFPGSAQNSPLFGGYNTVVNPQSLSQFNPSPPSDNTSPSPPDTSKAGDTQRASEEAEDFAAESALKRKASDDDFEEGPSQKNQHTGSVATKKGSATKRKSTGNTGDESRLMKRKEQNRAAQRAFRERKEKHVRDLEDQVAALEAKNEATTSENENLRDLLTRLQSENLALRQQASASVSPSSSQFTFTVPKSATSPTQSPQYLTDNSLFSTLPRMAYSSPDSNHLTPLDMSSRMTFDPSVLNLLDETPQQTATDAAMQMDYGYSAHSNSNSDSNKSNDGSTHLGWLPSNLTTITTNPTYFSLASMFESPLPPASGPSSMSTSTSTVPAPSAPSNEQSAFGFDFSSLAPWPTTTSDNGTLDDLFGGFYNPQPPMDVDSLIRSPPSSVSPVAHYITASPSTSASSSPASHTSDPSIFSARDGSSSESEAGHDDDHKKCPKTRDDVRQVIADAGSSPFVDLSPMSKKSPNGMEERMDVLRPSEPSIFVASDAERRLLQSVTCHKESTGLPITEKNDTNVEVLTAWRSITADPNFKECDIAKLCAEFSSKARCDGSKVVIEPSGVQLIRESLSRKH